MDGLDLVRFLHIITVVFMAAPLYNLIVVTERAKLGSAHVQVDRFVENLMRGAAARCYAFQATALITGLLLVGMQYPMSSLVENGVLLAKLLLLLGLAALLTVVSVSLQPRIDRLLAQVTGEAIPEDVGRQMGLLRLRRKRLAAVCLFVVILTVLLGLQIVTSFGLALNGLLVVLAGLFARRVYASGIPFGWF
jgi:hypothetical protein